MTPGQWYGSPGCLPVLVLWVETRPGHAVMHGLRLHRNGTTQKQTYPYATARRMLLIGRPDGAEVAETRAENDYGVRGG